MIRNLFFAALIAGMPGIALTQSSGRPAIPAEQRNLGVEKSLRECQSYERPPYVKTTPMTKVGAVITESNIGDTRFDQQTNNSMSHRIYHYQDGSTGAVWTRGLTDAGGFPDRGTGYNYNDGTGWASIPTSRVETIRTGWTGYAPLGEDGEIIVAHSATNAGLVISRRSSKGKGAWTQTYLVGPTGHEEINWPRVVTSGEDNNTVHILCLTAPESSGGALYQGQNGAILYYRSSDGGDTWDIQAHSFPGLDTSNYVYLGADVYSWAWPKGDTLAFVVANKWTDVVLMKSTNEGQTWTKTIAAYHPYPHFDFNTTFILDTPYVADDASAVALDNNGMAHVFFGLMRVNNDDITDDVYTFYPYTDGLAYWREGMPAFTTFEFDTLYDQGHIVGFVQDYNGNDSLDFIGGLEGLGEYVKSMSGMPTVTIDDQNNIFVLYSSLMENFDDGDQNYRHLMGRASFDGGLTWEDTIIDLTGSISHNYDECIFPSVSPTSGTSIHYIYQADEEPGIALAGDEDPYTENKIWYGAASKSDFGLAVKPEISPLTYLVQNYPNPFSDYTWVEVGLSRPAKLSISVYNIVGQPVWTMDAGRMQAGRHSYRIDRGSMPAGIYFISINADNNLVSKKIVAE